MNFEEMIENFVLGEEGNFEIKMNRPKEEYYQATKKAVSKTTEYFHCSDNGETFYISRLLGVIYHHEFN